MEFSCTAKQIAGRVVLTVSGEVDLAAHLGFEAEIERSWDGSSDLVIDCSQVTFLDSMGLRVLVRTRQRAVDNGRDFALAAPSVPVLRVLELAGIRDLFIGAAPVNGSDPDPGTAS